MTGIDHLLAVARAYGRAEGLNLTTVSWRAFGDTKKLGHLEAGRDVYSRRLEKAMRWFADNWPAGLDWPEGVPQPAVEAAAEREAC